MKCFNIFKREGYASQDMLGAGWYSSGAVLTFQALSTWQPAGFQSPLGTPRPVADTQHREPWPPARGPSTPGGQPSQDFPSPLAAAPESLSDTQILALSQAFLIQN